MVTSLIQMFTKWQHFHLGTELKTVVSSQITDTVVKKMVISTFGHRAKGCCVITDTVVKKMALSTFGYRDQD